LVETQLRWKQLPPWPRQLRSVHRYMTLERDMRRDNIGTRGRSSAITTAEDPMGMLADHQEHVRRYADARGRPGLLGSGRSRSQAGSSAGGPRGWRDSQRTESAGEGGAGSGGIRSTSWNPAGTTKTATAAKRTSRCSIEPLPWGP